MTEQQTLHADTLKHWLDNAGVEHYLCDQCHGLHLPELQALEGVVESRLFLEDWGLVLSTEYPIRPSALLPLVAELGHLNSSYPVLKLFADIVDDSLPQLVAGTTVLTGAGLSEEQFALFLATARETMTLLAAELKQMDFLLQDLPEPAPSSDRVH